MKWLLPLTLLIGFEALADILAKTWSIRRGWLLAAAALLGYVIANSFWLVALKNGSGLARGSVIFSVASAIVAIAIGLLLYHEPVSGREMIGIILGITAIILLAI